MEKKEVQLNEGINNIKFDVKAADIMIYSDNVKEPLVRYTGEFDIRDKNNEAIITERRGNNSINIIQPRGNNTIRINGNINGSIIISSGSDSSVIINDSASEVELIVPKKLESLSFSIDSKSGDLTIENLMLAKLIAKTISGNIELNDINMLFGKLETISGKINAKILESILNYKLFLKSLSGNTIQDSVESISPKMLSKKYQLEASSISGDIKILFKGKC